MCVCVCVCVCVIKIDAEREAEGEKDGDRKKKETRHTLERTIKTGSPLEQAAFFCLSVSLRRRRDRMGRIMKRSCLFLRPMGDGSADF